MSRQLLKWIQLALKQIIRGVQYAWPYCAKGSQWFFSQLQTILIWSKIKGLDLWTKYQLWKEQSEDVKRFKLWKASLVVRFEKKIIHFFHLEHLQLDHEGVVHVKLGKPHKMSMVLLKTIGILTLVMILWTAIANVDDIAHADGRVIPSAKMQVIQNQEGGIVQTINVQQGDRVNAGDVIVVLSPTLFGAEFDSKNTQMMALMAKAIRLRAEIDDKAPEFPSELIEKGKDHVSLEKGEFATRRAKLKADLALYETQYKNASAELEIIRRLVERGLEPQLELIRSQARVSDAKSRIDAIKSQFKSDASSELSKTMQELNPMQKSIPALADRLERTTIRSPVNGIVNRVMVTTKGGIVKAGESIAEVVPSEDNLVLEARISPKDIGFVKVGQDARIKITTYDYSIFGSMKGVVTRISADAVSTEERGQTVYYYVARIETESSVMRSLGRNLPIIPGMQAQVDIITGNKTVLQYLMKPIIGIRENAFTER